MKRSALTIALVIAMLVSISGSAVAISPEQPAVYGRNPSVAMKIFDAAFIRPLSAVASIVGASFGLALMPLAAPCLLADDVWNDVIVASWDFTVKRPLGDFRD
jgi:hypothetical protein